MNTVSRNLVWLLISQLATWCISLVVVLVVPHFLGVEGFGEYAFAVSFVGFFQLAGALGTSIFMTREIARDHSLVATYVYNALVMKAVIAIALSAMALGLGVALGFDSLRMTLIAIACGGMFLFLWNEVFAASLTGLQRMGKMSALGTIQTYVSSIGGIIVLAYGGGVVAYSLVMAATPVIATIGLLVLVFPLIRHHLHLDLGVWKALVVGGAPLMLLMICNQIYGTIDIPILAALTSTTAVGWYVLAQRWSGIPIFIANAVTGSHYPEMARLGKEPGQEFASLVNRAVKLTLLASTPAAVGLAAVAPTLIEVLYRPEFAPAVRPLQILALQIPITGMDTVLVSGLIACDRLRRYLIVAAVAAALNPLVTAALVIVTDRVWENGAIGAAIATALTELFVMCCAIALSPSGVMGRGMVGWWARCTLAGLSIFAVTLLPGESAFTLVAQVLLGVVLFVVATILLRVVSIEMLRDGAGRLAAIVRGRRASALPEGESDVVVP